MESVANARVANHRERDRLIEERANVRAEIKSWHLHHLDLRVGLVNGKTAVALGAMSMHPELQKLERRDAVIGRRLSELQAQDAILEMEEKHNERQFDAN